MIESSGKQQANRMRGLTSQRAGEPTHGNPIFTFFTLEEFAGSQSKGKAMTNLDSVLKQRHPFADKGPYSQSYGFSSSHVCMWELYYQESWVLKNWCFWTVVLEKTLESPLDSMELQPVHLKGNPSWIFIGRADAQTPILWPPDAKRWLIWKDPNAGKDWGQKEKGKTEDEMIGWHHWLNDHEFGWILGVGDEQGGLVCCSSWRRKESDMTERLNWTELR